MADLLYDNELLWMYKNAPITIQDQVTKTLIDSMAKEYSNYIDARDKGYVVQIDELQSYLYLELRAIQDKDLDFVFHTRKLSSTIMSKLAKTDAETVYVRLCAYGNNKMTLTFVAEDGNATSSNPALFSDDQELYHKITVMPVGTFCYYKTVYLRRKGEIMF